MTIRPGMLEVAEKESERRDDLRAARGIILAVAIGIVIGLIIGVLWQWL